MFSSAFVHSPSKYYGLAGSPANFIATKSAKTFVWCWTVPHRAQILCLNFIKYYSLWLHVSSQLSLLDDYFIIRKYNELNHRDRAQININSNKNIIQWLSRPSYLNRLWFVCLSVCLSHPHRGRIKRLVLSATNINTGWTEIRRRTTEL
jgi:hypothetical protein